MDTSLIAKVGLGEVIADFRDYLNTECGFKELANALPNGYLAQELEHIAKGAINRCHINMHAHLERTREIFRSFSEETAAQADDLADEMYILLRDELPQQLGKDKSVYTVVRDAEYLYIHLLMSRDAFSYGVDLKTIADMVV